MKKFSRFLFVILIAISVIGALCAAELPMKRKRIVEERMRLELADLERRIATTRHEHTAAARKYLTSLEARKKLQLLRRSAVYQRDRCYWFDDECRRIYSMTIAYLDAELKTLDERIAPEREEALRAASEHTTLVRKRDLIRSAEIPEEEAPPVYEVPELREMFRCVEVEGWNRNRGIFVEADQPFDLPFSSEVAAVVKEKGGFFVSVAFRDAQLLYSYVSEPFVAAGDVVPPYSPFFDRPSANPVVPGTVLVTLLYKGVPVKPSFMCRR